MSKQGRDFEEHIHSIISKTKNTTILQEKNIRSKYSTHISGIDHLIISDELIVAIQDKFVKSRKPTNTDIHHFKTCVNDLSKILNKKIVAVYLSLLEPTKPAAESFKFENSNGNNYFLFINNNNENTLILSFIDFLYEHTLFLYDNDDTYMRGDQDII